MNKAVLYLGADHNGYRLKEQLKSWLKLQHYRLYDLGANRLLAYDDYPVYAAAVAKAVNRSKGLGVLVCGSGHGMVIAANRFPDVRATLCQNPTSAQHARREDHANVLVLAARETTVTQAKKIVATWLKTTPSQARRHQRRVAIIERLYR